MQCQNIKSKYNRVTEVLRMPNLIKKNEAVYLEYAFSYNEGRSLLIKDMKSFIRKCIVSLREYTMQKVVAE